MHSNMHGELVLVITKWKYLKRRFSTAGAPIVARRQLPFLKQHENESIEELYQRANLLTLNVYEECEGDAIDEMTVKLFFGVVRRKVQPDVQWIWSLAPSCDIKISQNCTCKGQDNFWRKVYCILPTTGYIPG